MRNWKVWVLAVLLVAGAVFGWHRWNAASALEAAKQRVRDAGHPVTYAELDAYYARPVAVENRAHLLEYAMEAEVLPHPSVVDRLPIQGNAELPHRLEPIPPEFIEAMRDYLKNNEETIDAIFDSLELEACRFSVNLSAGPDAQLGHLARLRSLARILSTASLVAAIDGDTASAAKYLEGIFELGGSLESEPVLISQLVRIAIDGIGLMAIEQALNRADFQPEDLRELQEKLIDVEANGAFVKGLIGERCLWNAVEAMQFSLGSMQVGNIDLQDLWMSLYYRPSGRMDLDGVQYHALYEKMIAATELPLEEQTARAAAIEEETLRTGGIGAVTAILLPNITGTLGADVRVRTTLRLAAAGVAAARYRADHGAYPESLDALVPTYLDAVPVDPYGGAPVRYRLLENGFVVYSLSQNLSDEGGVELENAGDAWRAGDLTFTVERGNSRQD